MNIQVSQLQTLRLTRPTELDVWNYQAQFCWVRCVPEYGDKVFGLYFSRNVPEYILKHYKINNINKPTK